MLNEHAQVILNHLISDVQSKYNEYLDAVDKLGSTLNTPSMMEFEDKFTPDGVNEILRGLKSGISKPTEYDMNSEVPEMLFNLWKNTNDFKSAKIIPSDMPWDYSAGWFGVKSENSDSMKLRYVESVDDLATTDSVYELPFIKYAKYTYDSTTEREVIYKRFCDLTGSSKPFIDNRIEYEDYVGKRYPEGWYILEVSYLLDIYESYGTIHIGDEDKKFYTLDYLTEEDTVVTLQDNDWFIPNITEVLRLVKVEDALRELEGEDY